MESLFSYDSYKTYLVDYLKSQSKSWGIRTKLCHAMDIHNAYLSQVLNGKKDLNLEQSEKLGRFLSFQETEMAYWLTLIQFNRAGTDSLARFLEKRLLELRRTHLNVVGRLGEKNQISEKDQSTYYSSWIYAALHTALLVTELRTANVLANRFNLLESEVIDALGFLVSIGLIQKQGAEYVPSANWVRLPKTSPLITQHHTNVRFKAAESIQNRRSTDLHYGGFFTFSKKDFKNIQDLWLTTLKNTQGIVTNSPSEDVFGMCLDIFAV